MGLLRQLFEDTDQEKRDKQAAQIQGLLGTAPQEQILAPMGRMSVQLQGAQEGTGFRGSDMGRSAQADLYASAMQAGYSPTQAAGLLSIEVPDQQKPTSIMQNLQAAGVDLNTEKGKATMLDVIMKPQTQITMGSGAGTMWTPEQVAAAGLPTDSVVTEDRYGKPQILNKEKYTQPQHVSAGFSMRMNSANEEINDIFTKFPDFDPTSTQQHTNVILPDWAASTIRSPEGQRYRQAQENWISANLRKESGAVLGEQEISSEMAKWFPSLGDSPSVIAQKKRSRKDAENSLQKSAGGAYQELIDKAESDRLSELRGKHGTQ